MTATNMTEVIRLLGSEASRLEEFLSGLNEEDWATDSACDGWRVADVVAHLAMGAETWADSITRAVAGDAGPPPGQAFLEPGQRGSEIIAQGAITYRQQQGPSLLDNYTAGYARLREVLSQLRAQDWDKPCFHRRGPMPIRDYVGVRIQELAVHDWDIRSGLDESAEMGEEPLAVLAEMVPRWLQNTFRPGLGLPTPTRYRFQVSGPVPVHQDIVVNAAAFDIEPTNEIDADVTFKCSTGNYILLIYGRLDHEKAAASGRLSIEGRMELANNFTILFKGL